MKQNTKKENVIYPGVDTVRPPLPNTVKAPFIEILSIDPRERRITKVKFSCFAFCFCKFPVYFCFCKKQR